MKRIIGIINLGSTTITVYMSQYIGGSCPWFTVNTGSAITYSLATNTSLPHLTIDTTYCKVLLSGLVNSDAGIYNVTISGNDGSLPLYGQFSFTLTINQNQGPHNTTSIATQTIKSNTSKVYNITVPTGIFTEPEGEAYNYTMSVSPTASFLTWATNCTNITLTYPSNSNVGTYTVTLSATDGHADTTIGTTSFSLVITTNTPPTKNTTIGNTVFHGNRSSSYSFGSNLFYDSDGDTLTYTYTVVPTAGFLTVSTSSMSWSGFAANTDAGIYNITITANDDDPETASAISFFNLTVVANQPPTTTQTISNITVLAYYPVSIVWTSSQFSDINGDSISYLITTNSSCCWYTINNSVPSFTGTTSSNSQIGNFIVTLDSYDNYGGHSYYIIGLLINYNSPPAVVSE